jgi:ABC-type bacteriocin/lantibiotic exporter with double-glycine peptidase domain
VPLSEHEQRILDEIERRLIEEDPRLPSRTSLTSHLLRRVRWGLVLFVLGFVLLLSFAFNMWVAIGGFALMLASSLVVYHYLRRMGRDQMRVEGSNRLSITAALARFAERMRRPRGTD